MSTGTVELAVGEDPSRRGGRLRVLEAPEPALADDVDVRAAWRRRDAQAVDLGEEVGVGVEPIRARRLDVARVAHHRDPEDEEAHATATRGTTGRRNAPRPAVKRCGERPRRAR